MVRRNRGDDEGKVNERSSSWRRGGVFICFGTELKVWLSDRGDF